jgi:hypothetical protein
MSRIDQAYEALLQESRRHKKKATKGRLGSVVKTFEKQFPGGRAAAATLYDQLVGERKLAENKAKALVVQAMKKSMAQGRKHARQKKVTEKYDGIAGMNKFVNEGLRK